MVETPAFVNREGVHVPVVGDLPDVCAGICSAMIAPQRLAVRAALEGDLDALRQAMMLDPLTAAVCSLDEIEQMTDELLVAQADYLPQFADIIPAARKRLERAESLGTHDVWPETRFKPRPIAELLKDDPTLRDVCLNIFTGQHARAQ